MLPPFLFLLFECYELILSWVNMTDVLQHGKNGFIINSDSFFCIFIFHRYFVMASYH